MTGDDLVLDLVVSSLREDAAGNELVLCSVGAAVNDAFCVGVADAVEGLELVRGGRVDVEGRGGSGSGGFRSLGDSGCHGQGWNCSEQERGGEKFVTKIEHLRFPSLAVCFTAEEYESTRDASSMSLRLGSRKLTSPSSEANLKWI
jgi:hypothetical protein